MNWDELIQHGPSMYYPDDVKNLICEFEYHMGRSMNLKEECKIRDILCEAFEDLDFVTSAEEEKNITSSAMNEIVGFLQNIIDKN